MILVSIIITIAKLVQTEYKTKNAWIICFVKVQHKLSKVSERLGQKKAKTQFLDLFWIVSVFANNHSTIVPHRL